MTNLKKLESSLTQYKCNKCRDLTFIFKEDEASPCECRALIEAQNIIKNSGISESFRKMTLENFNYRLNKQAIEGFTTASKYVNNINSIINNRENSILFCGSVGSGKTHLSMGVANKLMDKGIGVIIMPYSQDIIRLKQNRMDKEYYNKLISKYKRASVVLIDDLFKGSVTDSDKSIIFEIIDYRYFNQKPLIISTEKTCEELLNIDEAIGSRIIEMSNGYIVENKGLKSNYRLFKYFSKAKSC